MNLVRVWLLSRQALREAAHLRVAWVGAMAGLAVVAGASILRDLNFGIEESRFLRDLAGGALGLFGGTQAILLTVGLIQGGLEQGLPALLLSRGVRRWEWLVASLVAVLISLTVLALGMCVLLGILLHWRGIAAPAAALLDAGWRDLLRLEVVAAFALATSAVSRSPLMATSLAVALALAAQLGPVIAWAGTRGRPLTRWVWSILARILPDFSALDGTGPLRAVAYATGYAILYAALACLVFSHREL